MSLLNGFISELTLAPLASGSSVDIDSYLFEEQPTEPFSELSFVVSGTLIAGSPSEFPILKSGLVLGAYSEDYYDRVFVSPSTINLGNLLSSQTRTFYVWNAYRNASKTLSSVTATGQTDGITITEPASPPLTFAPTEEKAYTANISISGTPVFTANYAFNFPDESPSVTITGRRVVIWPFLPSLPHEERFEHNTDIQRTIAGETRASLLTPARQVFKYSFVLEPQEFSRASALTKQWAQRLFGIPVWTESQKIASLSSGATTIAVSTNLLSYRADGLALIWKNSEEFEAVEILSVQSNQITLKLPLVSSWTNVRVMPLRLANTLEGVTFDRTEPYLIFAGAEFLVFDNEHEGRSIGFPTYRSKAVYSLPNVSARGLQERIFRAVDVVDNGTGPVVLEEIFNYADHKQEISIYCDNETERLNARDWLLSLRGKYGSFWLPSFNRDLILLQNITTVSTSILVSSIDYNLYYTVKDVAFFMKNGQVFFYRITGGTDLNNGTEQLALEAAAGRNINIADVDRISFMSCVRLDTDSVVIEHIGDNQAFIKAPVTEVPE